MDGRYDRQNDDGLLVFPPLSDGPSILNVARGVSLAAWLLLASWTGNDVGFSWFLLLWEHGETMNG